MLATTSLAASLRVLLRSSKRPRTNGANPTVTFLAKRRGAFIEGLRYGACFRIEHDIQMVGNLWSRPVYSA